jgi:hypothetical protein
MANIVTSYSNFSRAKLDHDMQGRYDLPIYQNAADVFYNWITNFKGNAILSAGFRSIYLHEDCEFIEFKYGTNQSYLCAFYANKIRFLAFDSGGTLGWVLSGGLPLEVATPYTLAEAKQLDYTQNNDVMVLTHLSHEPRRLIRTAANAFNLRTSTRQGDPFPLTWEATKAITAITRATRAQVTIVGHGYAVNDRVLIAGVVGMTEINSYTAAVYSVVDANNVTIDLDTTLFTAYSSGGTTAKVLTGSYPACCLFYKARLYFAATALKGTKGWGSETGDYDVFLIPGTITETSPLEFVIADIAQPIEWLFPGDNSLIAGSRDGIVAINGGGPNTAITSSTIQATLTSAEPCNDTYPFKKDGLIFYVGLNGRNVYFFRYDIVSESFLSEDANFLSYDITAGGISKMRQKKDKNDLVFCLRGDGALTSMNFKINGNERINGWHERTTYGGTDSVAFQDIGQIVDNEGNPRLFALVKRNGGFYIEMQADYVEFAKRSDFFTDDDAADYEAYLRYVGEQLRECCYLDNALTYSDLRSSTITFTPLTYDSAGDPATGTIVSSAADFTSGDIGKHMAYRTLTGYESGRYEITGYTATNTVTVSVLQVPTANIYSSWYMSFTTLSGLSQYNGETVGVVADGGYLSDFSVSGGAIDLGVTCTSIVVGYRYRGVIKTFPLGFQIQGNNTQVTLKDIVSVYLRCVASAGGYVGSDPYDLEPVQVLQQSDINYLPPIPIDGTSEAVDYTDTTEVDKCLWVIQDLPLPFQICSVVLNANYAMKP